jgi:hypothetical protein
VSDPQSRGSVHRELADLAGWDEPHLGPLLVGDRHFATEIPAAKQIENS